MTSLAIQSILYRLLAALRGAICNCMSFVWFSYIRLLLCMLMILDDYENGFAVEIRLLGCMGSYTHLVVWPAVLHFDINAAFRDPVEPISVPTGT